MAPFSAKISALWAAPGSEDTELGVLWSRRCVMERRQFTREFKLEAVRLIRERGVSYAKAAEDLGVHPTQLRNWVKQLADDTGIPLPPLSKSPPGATMLTSPPTRVSVTGNLW